MIAPVRRRAGLTLIELTVALAIFALLATALVVTLRNGIRTWTRVQQVSARQAQLRFACDTLERDAARAVLLNGANDADTPPLFTETAVSFVIAHNALGVATQLPQLERVLVRPEPQADGTTALIRRTAPYPAPPDGPLGRAQLLLPRLTTCRFTFLYYDVQTQEFTWRPLWEQPVHGAWTLPRGLRVEMGMRGESPLHVTDVSGLPLGVLGTTTEPP